ncbi:MAG: hypothetical protein IPK99_15140 [Flavobacteriales bacterium]|nr:hypothetical protein [Flavobacteriales bacterium]
MDTRGEDGNGLNGGQVWYKVTPTALYVNWVDVGYLAMLTDKHNSFQPIITDGTDPILGLDKNVSFCHRTCSGPPERRLVRGHGMQLQWNGLFVR